MLIEKVGTQNKLKFKLIMEKIVPKRARIAKHQLQKSINSSS